MKRQFYGHHPVTNEIIPSHVYDVREGWRMDVILKQTGNKMPKVTRVAMFSETNEGFAEITAIVTDSKGAPIVTGSREVLKTTFTANVMLCEIGTNQPFNVNQDIERGTPAFKHAAAVHESLTGHEYAPDVIVNART